MKINLFRFTPFETSVLCHAGAINKALTSFKKYVLSPPLFQTGLILFSLVFLFVTAVKSYAGWTGPTTIVAGTWGSGPGQFGLKEEDSYAQFAGPFYILSDGTIIIQDSINGRFVRYSSSGTIITTTVCVQDTKGNWNGDCRIEGDYEVTVDSNGFWSGSDEGNTLYFQDNTGTL